MGHHRVPLWPVKFVVFIGILMLAIQFLLDAIAETMMPIKADDERAMRHLMASLEIGLVGVVALFAAILLGVNVMVALGAVGALG